MSRVFVMAENTLILTEKRVMSRAVDCIGCIKIFEVVFRWAVRLARQHALAGWVAGGWNSYLIHLQVCEARYPQLF